MAFFEWNDQLSVGNAFIDNDHRHLIDLVNNLYDAIGEGRGPEVLESVLDELFQYTQEHFKREEDVMQGMHYADYSAHKKEHEVLTIKVRALQKKFIDGDAELAVEVLVFLYDLLFKHIMWVDKKLGQAIEDAKSGSLSQQ